MAGLPDSRQLELAPLRYLLPENRRYLLDLFAGTGFASSLIERFFDSTVLVEPHVEPAAASNEGQQQYKGCALSASSFESLPGADFAVCLAGFHHILGPESPDSKASHHQQRMEALRLWRSRLVSGGRLVIADVPAPGSRIGWTDGPLGNLASVSEPEQDGNTCFAVDDAVGFSQALASSHVGDYVAGITSLCRELGLGEAEPAEFFDNVVSELSPYGHVACFNSPQELCDLFREAGFENIRAFVAPTPWLFPTKVDAFWFVHELLGIGQPCSTTEELLTARERQPVESGVSDHLGLRQLPDGTWGISWKLMYVVGDRP